MAKAVTADLPASRVQRADLLSIHISVDAHVVVNDVNAACEAVFLQDWERIGEYCFAAIIKGQDDRFRRQLCAFFDRPSQKFHRYGLITPFSQKKHLFFKFER